MATSKPTTRSAKETSVPPARRTAKAVQPPQPVVGAIRLIPTDSFKDPELKLKTVAQVILGQQSNRRRATADIKHRGEVAGTTRKPWRQKGTGRARVGTRRNPIWRGGGSVFGPTNQRNFSKKINRQLILPALVSVLSSKAKRGELFELSELPTKSINKTKTWLMVLSPVLDSRSNLLVSADTAPSWRLAVRNLDYVQVVPAKHLSALTAAAARRIIFFPGALAALQERI